MISNSKMKPTDFQEFEKLNIVFDFVYKSLKTNTLRLRNRKVLVLDANIM